MTAHPALPSGVADAQTVGARSGNAWAPALQSAATAGVSLLAAIATLLVLRRLAGAATHPPDPAVLVTLGGIIVLAGWCLRLMAYRVATQQREARFARAISVATSTLVCALACGLTFATTPLAIRGVLWSTVLGSELAAWLAYRAGPPNRRDEPPRRSTTPSGSGEGLPWSGVPRPAEDVTVVQQQVRTRSAAGGENLTGDFRATFAPGQRATSLHVAFCPPFVLLPGVDVQQISGPAARLTIGQVLPYGARIDVKLSREAATETELVVHVTAECQAPGSHDRIDR